MKYKWLTLLGITFFLFTSCQSVKDFLKIGENSKNTESAERKKDPIDSASTSNLTEKTGKQEESAETGFQLEQIMEDKPRRRRTSVEKAGRKSRTAPEETGRRVAREIKEEFPDMKIIPISSRTGEGIDEWAQWLRDEVKAWNEK